MGEYVWTQIVIGGKATRAVADELQEILEATFPEGAEDISGHMVASSERNYGYADEAEAFCQANALPYVLTWGAAGGCFGSGSHAWRPGMDGPLHVEATDNSSPAIDLTELRQDAARGVTLAEIIARLEIADSDTLPRFEVEPGESTDAPHDAPDAAPAAPQTPDASALMLAELLRNLRNMTNLYVQLQGHETAYSREARAAIAAAEGREG